MSFTKVAQEVALQGIGGLLIGSAADSIFHPLALGVNAENFPKVTGEVAIQLGLNGFATSMYYEFLYKRGIRGDDPTKGVIFVVTLFAAQSRLQEKLMAVSKYISNLLRGLGGEFSTPREVPKANQPNFINGVIPSASADTIPNTEDSIYVPPKKQ